MTGLSFLQSRRIILFFSMLAAAVLACDVGLPSSRTPTAGQPTAQALPAGQQARDLALATVQVVPLLQEAGGLRAIWSGSGSLVDPTGLILTNGHVVDDRTVEYDVLGVAVTHSSDQPPEPSYLAEVVAVDYALDLAVIRVVSDLDGQPARLDLPAVSIGDSDAIEIGDRLRILGYPGIGGETITYTEGAVSGFALERGIQGRAWIKTDATIAGGNSGGLGANAYGELVGVPTIVTSGSEYGESVDCRPLADTDRDGDIDQEDTCVPVGGFINALRPINLAVPLIEAARQGTAYQGYPGLDATPSGAFDASEISFSNLVFADGVTESDQPTQLWHALPGTATHVCAFWDYRRMADGLSWSAYWFIEGELSEGSSLVSQVWTGGDEGNWWVCIVNEEGLLHGLYEIALEVDGEVVLTDAVYVGGDHTAAQFTLENRSSSPICEVNLSPVEAGNWGQDELDPQEEIAPGGNRAVDLASGNYDLRLVDCQESVLHEVYGLEIEQTVTYSVPPP